MIPINQQLTNTISGGSTNATWHGMQPWRPAPYYPYINITYPQPIYVSYPVVVYPNPDLERRVEELTEQVRKLRKAVKKRD